MAKIKGHDFGFWKKRKKEKCRSNSTTTDYGDQPRSMLLCSQLPRPTLRTGPTWRKVPNFVVVWYRKSDLCILKRNLD